MQFSTERRENREKERDELQFRRSSNAKRYGKVGIAVESQALAE
jgi:hypothetical protein